MYFINILRKQLTFSVKLTKPLPFHATILYPQAPQKRRLHGIKKGSASSARALILIRSSRTNSISPIQLPPQSLYSGAFATSTGHSSDQYYSRGDQYCFLLVTSTGSIADQYWSQSPSSESIYNYLYIRVSELPPHAGQAVGPDRYEEGQRVAAPRAVYVLSA